MFNKIWCSLTTLFESNAEQAEAHFLLDIVAESALILDENGAITYHNKQLSQLVGETEAVSLIGVSFSSLLATPAEFEQCTFVVGQVNEMKDIPIRKSDQGLVITQIRVLPLASGKLGVVIKDSSNARNREIMLIREAKTDRLTGLLNRKGFDERLEATIAGCSLESGFVVGVLFIDLDEFKPVNDTYGHDAGDRMLTSVAVRLEEVLQEHETAARIGGDEFVCILPVCESTDDLLERGFQILKAVANPVEFEGHELIVKCSIGGAIFSEDLSTSDELLKRADEAMYVAKNSGKNQVKVL